MTKTRSEGLPSPEEVLKALRSSSRGPLRVRELARDLGVTASKYKAFRHLLREMREAGQIYRVKGKRFAIPEKVNLVVGRLTTIRSGDAFVIPEDGSEDLFIPASAMDSAMNGDQVVVRVERRPRGRNPVGRVIKVLQRAHPTVVGTYRPTRKFGFVVPLDAKLSRDILIPAGEEGEAKEGELVVCRIAHYGDRRLNPVGEVERVLGPLSEPGVDVLSVIFTHGLPLEFPPEVEAAAEEAATTLSDGGLAERSDCRDLLLFTIDPSDAKDHDDALSVVPDGSGGWEVGIHIADVSHFVEEGGVIDLEAYNRATSVYLVDRVIPMLPHRLSSDVCSLKPGEDRLAVSVFVTFDAQGRVGSHRFERSVIRSRHRLAYEQVQEVLEGSGSIDDETDQAIHTLRNLASGVRSEREARGSLDFDLPEARVILGDDGSPIDIQRVLHLESHRLIEDFMVLANEVVAQEASERGLPVLYRVHEPPSPDRLEELRDFLGRLGYSLSASVGAEDLQRILKAANGKAEESLVSTVIVRSMSMARYHTENLGHFGLASLAYAHFTSPIRRYPDLVVHRAIVRLLEGDDEPAEQGGDSLEDIAQWTSERERAAEEAERDSVDLKKVEFMERHLGEDFRGAISGVTSFGFFVLLDRFFVEGLVHVNSMEDDFYRFREEEYALHGERSGKRYRLGDRVQVRVSRVSREERFIDFVLVEGSETNESSDFSLEE